MQLRRARRAVAGGLAAATLALALASCGSSGLPTSGTFTLSWKTTGTISLSDAALKPIPYSGSVAGIPVRGSAVNPARLATQQGEGAGLSSLPKDLHLAQWTGSFDSKSFTLSVYAHGLGSSVASIDPSDITVTATGSYGSDPIRATVDMPGANSPTVHFSGTIGTRHVAGNLTIPQARGKTGTARGTFTLTG